MAKTYAVIEVNHNSIATNATAKDKYDPIVKILYVHNDLSKTQTEFLRILGEYPTEKFSIKMIADSGQTAELFDIEKRGGSWLSAPYRTNAKVKTIQICEYSFPEKL